MKAPVMMPAPVLEKLGPIREIRLTGFVTLLETRRAIFAIQEDRGQPVYVTLVEGEMGGVAELLAIDDAKNRVTVKFEGQVRTLGFEPLTVAKEVSPLPR